MTEPDWAREVVAALAREGYFQVGSEGIILNVWSDTSGLATEMIAFSAIEEAIADLTKYRVTFRLYYACESDQHARDFITANHKPLHMSEDIKHRNLETKKYWCAKCNADHALPESGIDIYVAGYPCTPWSRKGTRARWNHPATAPLHIGLRTVAVLRPCVWILETSRAVDDSRAGADSALDDLKKMTAEIITTPYEQLVLRHVSPTSTLYPIRRPRVYIVNTRSDLLTTPLSVDPFDCILSGSLHCQVDYLTFLGIGVAPVNWDRVDTFPTEHEVGRIASDGCTCGVSPQSVCTVHPCFCGNCGQNDVGCAWRRSMDRFLNAKLPSLADDLREQPGATLKLTYLQVLEQGGLVGPSQARVRNMLNVFALLPKFTPLQRTFGIVDTTAVVDMISAQHDGTVPTVLRNSKMWSLSAGAYLSTKQLATLMGIDLNKWDLSGITEAHFRGCLGNAFHVASCGAIMCCAIAPLLR